MTDRGELPRELLHLAVLQLVTRSAPFTHAHSVPLHALSHLCSDYLQLVAAHAQQAAEHAGRHKATVWDVGHAIDDLAPGAWPEMRDQVDLADSGDSDGELERIRQLAHGFRDLLHVESPPTPIAHLHFGEMLPTEVAAINDLAMPLLPLDNESKPDIDDTAGNDAEAASSPATDPEVEPKSPPPQQEALQTQIQTVDDNDLSKNLFLDAWERDGIEEAPLVQMDMSYGDDRNESARPELLWKDPDAIPAYVPPFLPPFPGLERETAAEAALRRRKERELEAARAEARAADGRRRLAAARGNPWVAAIPYSSSMLAELHPASALPPASPPRITNGAQDEAGQNPPQRPTRRRARSISPPPTRNSLVAFRHTLPEMPHLPTWLRPNPKRRTAASTISLSADLAVASPDSLFGLLPVPATRQATRPPGFLPDYAPTRVHPFNTPLPYTISNPVPYNSAAGHVIAPPPHPRIPDTLPRLRQHLAAPTSDNLSLFSRTTRMGPPGPLGPKGEALDYEYVGDSAVLALNVEWPIRAHNAKLPTSLAGDETPAPAAVATPAPGSLTNPAPTPAATAIAAMTPAAATIAGPTPAAATASANAGPVGIKLKLGRTDSPSASPAPSQTPAIVVNEAPAEPNAEMAVDELRPALGADMEISTVQDEMSQSAEVREPSVGTTARAVDVGEPQVAVHAAVTNAPAAPTDAPQVGNQTKSGAPVPIADAAGSDVATVTSAEPVTRQTNAAEPAATATTAEPVAKASESIAEEEAPPVKVSEELADAAIIPFAESDARSVEPTPTPEPRIDSVPATSAPASVQEASASTSRMSSVEPSPQPVKLPSFKIRFSSSKLGGNAGSSPSVSPGPPASASPSTTDAPAGSPAPASLAAPRPSLTLKLSPRPSSSAVDSTKHE
ncbi:hypothetical protein OIV83_004755 [Microbotryomycetes sp. JL201]|nr:hypothetical protein OIV83_004755 [Microbotryomycetes sp. JL201]